MNTTLEEAKKGLSPDELKILEERNMSEAVAKDNIKAMKDIVNKKEAKDDDLDMSLPPAGTEKGLTATQQAQYNMEQNAKAEKESPVADKPKKISKLKAIKPEAVEKRLKLFVYGESGVGKTTASIQFPNSYIIDTFLITLYALTNVARNVSLSSRRNAQR